jgi:hypothetical protein
MKVNKAEVAKTIAASAAAAATYMGQVVVANQGAVVVTRTVLTIGRFAIASPFASVAVTGSATAMSPVVAAVAAGVASYAAINFIAKKLA